MDLLIPKAAPAACRVRPAPPLRLRDGEVLLRVERFAFTANNKSYVDAGDALGYWKFWPHQQDPATGRVPVWAVAEIVASRHPKVARGRRVYGFLPPSSFAVVQPVRVSRAGFTAGEPHRADLPAVYNALTFCDADPFFVAEHEDAMLLLRPLFLTSWLLDDFLDAHAFFAADAVVLSSASSKTAVGLAWMLKRRGRQCQVVGLTSARNTEFVRSTGLYDAVLHYDEIGGALPMARSVYVDFGGARAVRKAVHERLRDLLLYDAPVGTAAPAGMTVNGNDASRYDASRYKADMPGPQPIFFFAPAWIAKRLKDWGGMAEMTRRVGGDYQSFVGESPRWLEVVLCEGPDAVVDGARRVLAGGAQAVPPSHGLVMSLWPSSNSPPSKL